MNAYTDVELYWLEGQIERWIRFGRPGREVILDRRRRVMSFAPGSVFAFVRWASNDYGALVSRADVLRAVGPGEAYSTVPCVTPGAEILLRIFGWPKVEEVLAAIDAVDALGLDPADIDPNHWRHVHNRMSVGLRARPYTLDRHRAWLLRRRLKP